MSSNARHEGITYLVDERVCSLQNGCNGQRANVDCQGMKEEVGVGQADGRLLC